MYVATETGTERSMCIEQVYEDIVGGGIIDPDDFKTTTTAMGEGSFVGKDSNGIYHIVKTALIHENAGNTATDYKVKKGHEFVVGDVIVDSDLAGASKAIASITTTETDYDTITVAVTLGHAVTTADCLIQAASAQSAGAATYKYTPAGIAMNAVDLTKDNLGCGIMVRGTVNESLLPYKWDAILKAKLPLVRFI